MSTHHPARHRSPAAPRSPWGRALVLALALLLVPALATAQDEPADNRPGVAVLPLENGGSYGPDREDVEALQVGLQQMLLTELDQSSDLRIVERTLLRDILDEQQLAVEGRVDPSTAVQIGQLVQARYIVTGSFMDLWGDFRMDVRIFDAETSELVNTARLNMDREELYTLVVDMASLIMEGVDLPALSGEVREERRSREIPAQAVTLYSRAQVMEDLGQTDEARELYQRIVQDFPDMTEAGEALEQLSGA